jgi:ribosomal protein S6--L-glutamate ligase
MKITILSRSASIPSTARLLSAGRERGHRMAVLNPVQVQMHLDGRSAKLYHSGKAVAVGDVIIPRIAQSVSQYGLAVVAQFEMRKKILLNGAQAIAQARNKMRSLQVLSANGIDIPATVMAREAKELKSMVKLVGGMPVLVKLLQREDKRGVMVCQTLQSLEAALQAVLGLGHNLIVQQYVKHTGQDIRVLVVGDEAIAAVRRRPRVGRLAHTLNTGARLEPVKLSEAQRQAAIKAVRLIQLEVAAVDMLDVQGSPKVFEVNASPALAAMEQATGLELASKVIVHAEKLFAERGAALQG